MATAKRNPFEKYRADKERPRFGKEGSKKGEAVDKKQGPPGYKCGGKTGRKK